MFRKFVPTCLVLFLAGPMLCGFAAAGTLASDALLAPLSPGQSSRMSIPMPADFKPDQPLWLVYEMVAIPGDGGEGEVGFEQSFEGVKTPLSAFYATFKSGDMQEVPGDGSAGELQRLLGPRLYPAYESLGEGQGRLLAGRLVRELPAPGTNEALLLVSAERATGMKPLAVKLTVGQGELPAEFQQKPQDSLPYRLGFLLGLMAFGWLVMRWFRRRSD